MRLSLVTTLTTLPVAFVSAGCAGSVSGTADAEAGTTTSAVIVIERNVDATQGARAEGSARFIRVAAPASAADALHVIGAALDLPPRGACATVSSLAGASVPTDTAPFVQLVDVGAVSLEADGVGMRLLPRQLPDVTDVVTGVVYDRAAEAALLPAASRYVTHVTGGPGLPSFDVVSSAPSDATTVRLTGEDGQGRLTVTGGSVELAWPTGSADDVVYIDLGPGGVRCVFDDVGHGSVSTLLFDDAGTVMVHRL